MNEDANCNGSTEPKLHFIAFFYKVLTIVYHN